MEMTKGWAELECAQHIQILNPWPNHANVCVGAFSEGLQANTGWKEVKEGKEGKWKEHARKWNELKETWTKSKEFYSAWKHTHTDKRNMKGTMTVMEAKRKGKKQCKENDRERKKREKS